MSNATFRLLALSAVAVTALTACGGNSSNSTSTTSTTATSTATSTAGASDTGSASPSATEASSTTDASASTGTSTSTATSAGAGASGDASSATKSYTNASLAKVLDGKTLGGQEMQAANEVQVAQIVSAITKQGQTMTSLRVTPAACKTETLSNMATWQKDKARAVLADQSAGTIVVVRTRTSPQDAVTTEELIHHSNSSCSNATLTGSGGSVTLKAAVKDLALATAQHGNSADITSKSAGKTSRQTAAYGTYGNVVIAATSPSGTVSVAKLGAVVDDTAKALASDMAK